jgi:methylthioribose-1-phosphate isomerase
MLTSTVRAVQWVNEGPKGGSCRLLDQKRLPSEENFHDYADYRLVSKAIADLTVRGAPAIGVAAAYAVVLAAQEACTLPENGRRAFFDDALHTIAVSRPTAVNLGWAVARMGGLATGRIDADLTARLLREALVIQEEDIAFNNRMARLGSDLLREPVAAMTYCNTGDLATGGVGTAFGVLRQGYVDGKVTHVYTCETRPVLQGLRLTAWELAKNKIPFTAICDNMAASVMRARKVGAVFVGADRIAANGDAANKVGTYALAVAAQFHRIPFYVVAPSSSFDLTLASGEGIPIEQRASEEIVGVLGSNRPPYAMSTFNPSFDVTPHELITAIICEKGVIVAPDTKKVEMVFR